MSAGTVPQHPSAPAAPPPWVAQLQSLFAYDGLGIRQKVFSLSHRYLVTDLQGMPRFYVVRPPVLGQALLSAIGGTLANLVFLVLAFQAFFVAREYVLGIVLFIVGGYVGLAVRVLLSPYRDLYVYTDEAERNQVMLITQDNKFSIFRLFTIYDPMGHPVARARRHVLKAFWRREWTAETLDGRLLFRVREDTLVLSILRRYLGPLWGALRTNFDFLLPNGARIGEFNRKLTLTDQYMLDLRLDPYFLVDRRVALAMAILLDSAEGR